MGIKIPFYSLSEIHTPLRYEFLEAVAQLINRGCFILGEEVMAFENNFANYCHTGYSIGVGNGLDALKIALKCLNIGKGDDVIVPAHTYIATWLAVSETGASIIPIDANPQTMNMDADLLESVITPNTKAVIPVHLYGQMCEMDKVVQVANKYGLYIVEDFAQAHGSIYDGKPAGAYGHINATSFYPGKNLGALGDAGALTTNNKELEEKARILRNYGSAVKYQHELVGVNSRLDTLQAVFLSIKLQYLDQWNSERQRLAAIYKDALEGIGDLKFQENCDLGNNTYHLFVVRTRQRDELQKHLRTNGIETLIHYPIPPYSQKAYRNLGINKDAFIVTELISKTSLSLPLYPGLKKSDIIFICDKIIDFYRR